MRFGISEGGCISREKEPVTNIAARRLFHSPRCICRRDSAESNLTPREIRRAIPLYSGALSKGLTVKARHPRGWQLRLRASIKTH